MSDRLEHFWGRMSRLAALGVIGTMTVATYVHLAVDDPVLFPLQPSEPIIPVAVIALSLYILWRGAGAWNIDLRATGKSSRLSRVRAGQASCSGGNR